jgi:outer membrane lipoprotein SlyB
MGMASQSSGPASLNISAGSASDMAQIIKTLMSLNQSSPAPVVDMNPEYEGAMGGIAGAALGGAMGGIPGAIAGGSIGDKLTGKEKAVDEMDRDPGIEDAERDDSIESVISMAVPKYNFTPVDHDTAMKIATIASKKSNVGSYVNYDNVDEFYNYLEKRGLVKNTDEAFANEPNEKYQDHKFMTKDLSGGINRQKTMYPPAAKGDNPMAVESIKDRLYRALNEKKSKDLSEKPNEGNEFSGALAQAKKMGKNEFEVDGKKYKVKEAAKPDFLDMDKDGNKKEPMKKAVADKKKDSVDEAVPLAIVGALAGRAAAGYVAKKLGKGAVQNALTSKVGQTIAGQLGSRLANKAGARMSAAVDDKNKNTFKK